MNIVELFREGGFIMLPLLICSIFIWAVVIEKFWHFSKFHQRSFLLHEKIKGLLLDKKFHEARGVCASFSSSIEAPYRAIFDGEEFKSDTTEARISRRLDETKASLRRFLWVLGTIGASSPFIGLFGTVVGIIKSFESIASTGKSGFAVVAAGLSEALIATAAGIIVAVIAVIFYNYFQNRLNEMMLTFKNQVADLYDLVSNEKEKEAR